VLQYNKLKRENEELKRLIGELALIMHKLNHSDLAYTKRCLGITDEELEEVVKRLNL